MGKIKNGYFIIGTRKSGTTSLYELLKKYSHFSTSNFKETQFFTLPKNVIEKNIDWYISQFSQTNNILEASTLYYIFQESLDNISEFVENPKFIIIIRDPAKRAYSSYNHMIKKRKRHEKRYFKDILKNIKKDRLDNIAKQEIQQNIDAAKNNLINIDYANKNYLKKEFGVPFNFSYPKNLWPYNYLTESLYSQKIPYLENKYNGKLCILIFEKLISCQKEELLKLQHFFKDAINLNIEHFPVSNKTIIYKDNLLRTLFKKIPYTSLLMESEKKNDYENNTKMDINTYNYIRKLLREEYEYWIKRDTQLINFWRY